MLEQLQGVAIALGDKSLSDAERGQILKNLTGEFAKTFPTGTEQLCRDNLPVFARLVGQLQKLAGDPSISKSTRDACMDVAMIAQALYNNLLALAPEERQMELELIPDNTGNPAGNLAANVNPLKSFPHNATSAQMFAGFKELESSEEGKEDQIKYRGMMEKLGCPDYKLIALFNSSSSLTISESTGTLTENDQGYKVISHLHNNISNMAASLKSAHENSAGYDPAQIDDFAADVYLSGLTDEQKRNLLASLKDPGVREYLEVASNYARKNEALPDNIVVPKLLTLGNNGKYFAEAAKVLQLAANKAAQQLGEPAPGQIYDPNSTKTVIDLAKSFGFDENFIGTFTAQFRKYCTPFDNDAYLVGNHLNQAQHDAVNNLFKNLKAPEAQNGINTILLSPRRWGKTSLVNKVASMVNSKDIIVVTIDIFSCRNEYDFYNVFSEAILKQTASRVEEWKDLAKGFIERLVPKISWSLDGQNEYGVSLGITRKNQQPKATSSMTPF